MNESTPAHLRPRVPWWERVAAGVLALFCGVVGLVMLAMAGSVSKFVSELLQSISTGWQTVLKAGSPSLEIVLNNTSIIESAAGVVALLLVCGNLLLLPFAIARAVGRGWLHRARFLWIAVLVHGLLAFLFPTILSRLEKIQSDGPTPWFRGWFRWSFLGEFWKENPILFAFPFELLLAALVLWFTRKRRQKPKAADSTAQA